MYNRSPCIMYIYMKKKLLVRFARTLLVASLRFARNKTIGPQGVTTLFLLVIIKVLRIKNNSLTILIQTRLWIAIHFHRNHINLNQTSDS